MPTFVALLRGVNVGKARRIAMADFRALLGELGHQAVTTLLNSGNAVFDAATGTSARHAKEIAVAISNQLALEVSVVVKSASELAAIVEENPIDVDVDAQSRFLVIFVQEAQALRSLAVIEASVVPPERFHIGRHAAYLLCATGILESKAAAALVGKLGGSVTTRNWATVVKLHALAARAGA